MHGYLKAVVISGLIPVIWSCSDDAGSYKSSLSASQSQIEFCKVVRDYRDLYRETKNKKSYLDQKTDLTTIFNQRTNALKEVLNDGRIEKWQGKIGKLLSVEGKGAFLEINLPCNVVMASQDNLIIRLDSPLYQNLRGYSEDSNIVFSGNFLVPNDTKEQGKYPYEAYYGEESITENGSMSEPEFLFRYSDFH